MKVVIQQVDMDTCLTALILGVSPEDPIVVVHAIDMGPHREASVTLDDARRLFASLTDLDDALPVHDCSNETLLTVAQRLGRSSLPRHCVLREAELDDLWRYVEVALECTRNNDEDASPSRHAAS